MTAAYAQLLAKREHAALVRGDDGALHIRRFSTAGDASLASQARDLTLITPAVKMSCRLGGKEWRLAAAAREIGVSSTTLRRALPHIRHRRVSAKITYLPASEVIFLKQHGLLARLRGPAL